MVDQLDYELKTNQLQSGKFFIELSNQLVNEELNCSIFLKNVYRLIGFKIVQEKIDKYYF